MAVRTQSDLWRRATDLIPGGVNSPVRAMRAVGLDEPVFMERGEGAFIEDVDGNRYVDWVMSWGPLIFGHADEDTVAAVVGAAARGTTFGAPTEAEVELAAEIAAAVPSIDQVRLVSSGTEAAMSAIRLARGATGRDRVLKFAGCYHGHVDALLAAAGSGVAALGTPSTPGVPTAAAADTIVCPYNDAEALTEAFARYGDTLACVIVEPVAGNMGVVPPAPGFLAALGGRADVMDELAPLGPVYQAGTLSGNPLATAAGLAVLSQLDDDAYADLTARATRFADGLRGALTAASVKAQVTRVGTLTGLFFADTPVTCFSDAQAADHAHYARFFHGMLAGSVRERKAGSGPERKAGSVPERTAGPASVFLPPSGYEAMFVSLAHTDADLERTIDVAGTAAANAAA